jgi:hypothetical protein
MSKHLSHGALGAVAVAGLVAIPALAQPGAAMVRTAISGTWFAGPGCGGRIEWYAHPSGFPYFCDGSAGFEEVHWLSWGGPTAKANGTMNEADLRTGAPSVAQAPRIKSAVTITVTHQEFCHGRHVYRSVRIRYDKPTNPQTLIYSSLLPKGC